MVYDTAVSTWPAFGIGAAILAGLGCARATATPRDEHPPTATATATVSAVHFPSCDGDLTHGAPTSLDGILYMPAGVGPFPAVVALHGCNGLRDAHGDMSARDREWAERLRDLSYVVLYPDSFTPRGVDEICSRSPQPVRPSYERNRDAYGALLYLQSLPQVSADRIALMGWSNGAIAVLFAAASTTHARPAGLLHDFRAAVAFYPDCRSTLADNEWTPAFPIHIFIGALDDWTPAPPCQALAERPANGGRLAVTVIPGAFHDFDAPDQPLHTKHHVGTTPSGTATLGTDAAGRAQVIEAVPAILARELRRP